MSLKSVELETHPSHNVDLVPCDYFIFSKIKDLMRFDIYGVRKGSDCFQLAHNKQTFRPNIPRVFKIGCNESTRI